MFSDLLADPEPVKGLPTFNCCPTFTLPGLAEFCIAAFLICKVLNGIGTDSSYSFGNVYAAKFEPTVLGDTMFDSSVLLSIVLPFV